MPKSLHERAKADLQDIWMAATKTEATAAFDLVVETYGVKYEKAVGKLVKDRDELLAFYDFRAEHSHDRSQEFIQVDLAGGAGEKSYGCAKQGMELRRRLSRLSFAGWLAARPNRTRKTKGCLNRKTALAMVYRLMMSAKKKWRKISGPNRLPEVTGESHLSFDSWVELDS